MRYSEETRLSRYPVLLAIVGVHLGILGLIVAAGSPDVTRQSGNAIWGGFFVWLVGLIFIVGAFFEAARGTEPRPG